MSTRIAVPIGRSGLNILPNRQRPTEARPRGSAPSLTDNGGYQPITERIRIIGHTPPEKGTS